MPRVSQNHDGSPKRRLQPILLLDEPLGSGGCHRRRDEGGSSARSSLLWRVGPPECSTSTVCVDEDFCPLAVARVHWPGGRPEETG